MEEQCILDSKYLRDADGIPLEGQVEPLDVAAYLARERPPPTLETLDDLAFENVALFLPTDDTLSLLRVCKYFHARADMLWLGKSLWGEPKDPPPPRPPPPPPPPCVGPGAPPARDGLFLCVAAALPVLGVCPRKAQRDRVRCEADGRVVALF